jgi:hypothetical protein
MRLTTAAQQLRRVLVPLLLIGATALAVSSFAIDQIRIAEEQAEFSDGNTGEVQIHRRLYPISLPLGLCSMALCGIAWWNTKRRVLVGCAALLLAPIALHLYSVYLLVAFILAMLGIYKGPLP